MAFLFGCFSLYGRFSSSLSPLAFGRPVWSWSRRPPAPLRMIRWHGARCWTFLPHTEGRLLPSWAMMRLIACVGLANANSDEGIYLLQLKDLLTLMFRSLVSQRVCLVVSNSRSSYSVVGFI